MKKNLQVPSDVIICTICFLEAGTRFPEGEKIHNAFLNLSRNGKFSRLFKEVIFDEDNLSDTVYTALQRMRFEKCIVSIDEEEYEVVYCSNEKKALKLFYRKDVKLIKLMAQEFSRLVGAHFPPWHKSYKAS